MLHIPFLPRCRAVFPAMPGLGALCMAGTHRRRQLRSHPPEDPKEPESPDLPKEWDEGTLGRLLVGQSSDQVDHG